MIAKYLFPAVAVIGSAAAQCTSATATINSNAEATQLASQCKTFNGNILVSTAATGTVDFSGLGQVKGDFIAESAGALNELSSTTLNSITGIFHLRNLTALASLRFPSLDSVGSIDWQSLSVLDKLTFGTPGITKATDIKISDTFLSSLDGIDVTSLRSLDLNNNFRLETLNSPLTNLSWTMNFLANHREMKVSFPSLTWAANMTISNVTTFELPALQTVNGSAIFTSNKAVSFAAPNVTSVGTINFISNNNLKNISFPQLASIAGGIVIANNTLLPTIDGFPKLKTIGGDVKLRGNFSDVEFPVLNDVKGAFDVVSTTDISETCDKFQKLAPSKQGGGNQIQGVYRCKSNDDQANSDTGTNTSTSGTTGGGSGNKDGGNSAAGVAINAAMLGLAVVGGVIALL